MEKYCCTCTSSVFDLNTLCEFARASVNTVIHHTTAMAFLCKLFNCLQMLYKACSDSNLLLIAFLLTLTSISLAIILHFPCPRSSVFLPLKRFFLFWSLFSYVSTSNVFLLILETSAIPSFSHLTLNSSLDVKYWLYQSHFLIHPFPPVYYCSISHCSTPPFTPSITLMVNSISNTPLTQPHRAQPLRSER